MSRNLDPTLADGLSAGLIQPVIFVQITLQSGIEYVWSGIGDFVFNGNTFTGVGDLGSIGPIAEGSAVKADGTSVTLSGIGFSDIPVVPNTGTPPVTPAPGESVAFSIGSVSGATFFQLPPSIWNGFTEVTGSAFGSQTTGALSMTNGISPVGGPDSVGLSWFGFPIPAEIPPGATITHVYAECDCTGAGGFTQVAVTGPSGTYAMGSAGSGLVFSPDLGGLDGVVMSAICENSVEGPGNANLNVADICLAVYYIGTPVTKASLLYEALNDVRLGGPVKIWYGLMANGALVGTPYLIFKGTVDKPSVKVDDKSASITLACENRLVDLQRANQRRYTAADQKLAYPTDMAFNWVETLNDIALRWGT